MPPATACLVWWWVDRLHAGEETWERLRGVDEIDDADRKHTMPISASSAECQLGTYRLAINAEA